MTITVEDLHELQKDDSDCVLVDVRTPAEFDAARIEGAENVPLGDLGSAAAELSERAKNRRLVLICQSGKRARIALDTLHKAGVEDATILVGGIEQWRAKGLPVAGQGAAMSIERQVRIAAGTLVVLGVGLSYAVSPWFVLLSGFVGAGLVFAGITDTCGMGMLLARMPWNRRRKSRGDA